MAEGGGISVYIGQRAATVLAAIASALGRSPAPVVTGGGGGSTISTSSASSVTVPAPSGSGSDITFTFSTSHQVGQFPNGDYFVLPNSVGGTVSVTAITPTYSTGRHGWMVNPKATAWNAPQRFDDRGATNDGAFSTPVSLPLALSANDSLVKVASLASQTSYSFIQHAAVLTCLASSPATGTMRPAAFGTDKRLFSSANITASLFPNLTASAVPDRLSAATALARCSPFRNDYHPGPSWGYYRASTDSVTGGKTWGGDILKQDIEIACSLCLAHLSSAEKVQIAVALAQHGIDTWGVCVPATGGGAGFLRGGGANGAGHLFLLAFAAWATDDSTLKSFLSAASEGTWNPVSGADIGFAQMMFWETTMFYRGTPNGDALWGKQYETWIGDSESQYWSELSAIANGTLRDPYEIIDGGSVPGDAYQGPSSHQILGLAALFDNLPGLKAVWPTLVDNAEVLHEYGHRWASRGVLTLPDPAAPKGGVYGTNYGPNGSGSYIAGSGRLPLLDSTGAHGGNRFSDLTDDFYLAYATP